MYSNTGKLEVADQKTAFVRRSRLGRHLNRFAKDDGGAILALSIYFFLLILMIAGVGIDVMKTERERSKLQATSDRASLAAADLDQTLDPLSVVEDYFDKAGLSDYLISVDVDEGLGYRVVEVHASTTVDTQFMRMTGVDTLTAPASSTAEERIDGVEISLVLDVSGSMGSNNRLTNMKTAAKDFIDTMMDNSEEGKVSISIIPYATQVSTPEYFFNELPIASELVHDNSRCINFTSSDFNTTTIDLSAEMQQTMHFDPYNTRDKRDDDPVVPLTDTVCVNHESREMMVLQNDAVALKSFISSFYSDGYTSIDLGMKWAAALLDPSLNPAIENLIDSNDISSDFTGRPNNYNDGETIKVVVLMTDGENTNQYYIEDEYREGESNIWWNELAQEYSVYVGLDDYDQDNDGITNESLFYWPKDDSWQDHAYGEGDYEETQYAETCKSYRRNGSCRRYQTVATGTLIVDEPGKAEIVSYPDLWTYTSLKWNAKYNYRPWMGESASTDDWFYDVRGKYGSSTKDARTKAICDATKDRSVLIYTIAFEAPTGGEVVLKDCASSVSHFFSVDGIEISNAFDAIASSIRQLRLTQ
jgi:Flp pilus assembly protein TadG